MLKVLWTPHAWNDYVWWQFEDRKTLKRINALIADIQRNGNEGIGKPEPLRYEYTGFWSRRIDGRNRLVYRITEDTVEIVACRFHYGQKHSRGPGHAHRTGNDTLTHSAVTTLSSSGIPSGSGHAGVSQSRRGRAAPSVSAASRARPVGASGRASSARSTLARALDPFILGRSSSGTHTLMP